MSIAPLTTTFTPAPSCLASSNVWEIHISTSGVGDYDSYLYYLQGPPSTSDCLPTDFNPSSTAFYTPGLCPSGYSPACSMVNGVALSTGTTMTCCPTVHNFTCGAISTTVGGAIQLTTLGCQSQFDFAGSINITKSSNGTITPTVASVNGLGGLNAYGIVVHQQAGDFPASTTSASTSSTSSPSPSPTPSSTPAATSSSAPSLSSTSSNGLSTGAKAGIGVGVGVGVIALLAAGFLGYKFGQRKRGGVGVSELENNRPRGPPPVEMPADQQKHELDTEQAKELPDTQRPEMAGAPGK